MKAFADLLERLLYTPQRGTKLTLIVNYLRTTPDPDRGWGVAALTGSLQLQNAKPALIRDLVTTRTDPVLFGWSYDFVGDLAETAALIWPERSDNHVWPHLTEIVSALETTPRHRLPDLIGGWLDTLDANGRWALLKLVTGSLRVGVSARLTKVALADYGPVDPSEIEEVWHCVEPPYIDLFAWLDGRAPRPALADAPVFRPLMLAHPLEEADLAKLEAELDAYLAEWKWDGIRIQVSATPRGVRVYSRTGDDIGDAFPELTASIHFHGVVDGELLVGRAGEDGEVRSFNDLQQRLNRRSVTPTIIESYPVFIRLYDILMEGQKDLRPLPLTERRKRLEAFIVREQPRYMDISPLVTLTSLGELDLIRSNLRDTPQEGLMLKRKTSAYMAGRPKGLWWKWKRDALLLDCVLMYAQRGHGKRSSFYSDYTFGVWRNGEQESELVPVGKAYFGFTDEELRQLDSWIRNHTINRFGPVREVEPRLVLEIAFDAVHRSVRHKSGVAMRFPRVHRIRWDKSAKDADHLQRLERLI
jgi:DNA ligase 1